MEILNEVRVIKTIVVTQNGYPLLLKVKRINYVFMTSKSTVIRTKDGEFEVEETVQEVNDLMQCSVLSKTFNKKKTKKTKKTKKNGL